MDTRTYEPPPLATPDPDSDTRVPHDVRVRAVEMAIAALDASKDVKVSLLAAIEEAYASGYDAGVKETFEQHKEMLPIVVTEQDDMAASGEYTQCGISDGWADCNRAVGHVGDHAQLVDDDRGAGMVQQRGWYVAQVWGREEGTVNVASGS